jgi:hypothetical protein
MIVSNDGGATVTFNGGKSWSTQNNQPTAQFYRVALDSDFPYHAYGAQQDNSTVRTATRGRGGITEKDWYDVGGGERAAGSLRTCGTRMWFTRAPTAI